LLLGVLTLGQKVVNNEKKIRGTAGSSVDAGIARVVGQTGTYFKKEEIIRSIVKAVSSWLAFNALIMYVYYPTGVMTQSTKQSASSE
jgi:hypothetical protein